MLASRKENDGNTLKDIMQLVLYQTSKNAERFVYEGPKMLLF